MEPLVTERLVVRPWTVDDAEQALAIYGAADVTRWLTPVMQRVPDLATMRSVLQAWVEAQPNMLPPRGRWAVERQSDKAVIGGLAVRVLPPYDEELQLNRQVAPQGGGGPANGGGPRRVGAPPPPATSAQDDRSRTAADPDPADIPPRSTRPSDPPPAAPHPDDDARYGPDTGVRDFEPDPDLFPDDEPSPTHKTTEETNWDPIRVAATVGAPSTTEPARAIEGAPTMTAVATRPGEVTGVQSGAHEARRLAAAVQNEAAQHVANLRRIRAQIAALGEQTLGTVQMANHSTVVAMLAAAAEAAAAAENAARSCASEVGPSAASARAARAWRCASRTRPAAPRVAVPGATGRSGRRQRLAGGLGA